MFDYALFYRASQIRWVFCLFVFVFLHLWHPAQTKCIGAIFPITFAHFVPLCHILAMFQTFSLLLYLLK